MDPGTIAGHFCVARRQIRARECARIKEEREGGKGARKIPRHLSPLSPSLHLFTRINEVETTNEEQKKEDNILHGRIYTREGACSLIVTRSLAYPACACVYPRVYVHSRIGAY